jgi:glycosyltransferase involved in cell wall biosynthesis
MKVLLLGNYAPDRQHSMQRFASVLLEALPKRGVEARLIRPEPRWNFTRAGQGPGKYLGYVDKFAVFPCALRRTLREWPDAVVHVCDHANAPYVKHLQRTPHLVTCHDLIAVRSARGETPEYRTGWTGRRLQQMILAGINRARLVACVSHATRDEVLRLTKLPVERVKVVLNGLNYPYSPMPPPEAAGRLRRFNLGGPFLLHVGSDLWYKNREGLLRIYRRLRELMPEAPQLVLAGGGHSAVTQTFIREHHLASHVTLLGGCESEDLRALYSAARWLVFPSLVEGFGWPIIEAQACGCPVATSNRPPMNEIGGEAAVYFDPADEAGAAETLRNALREPEEARAARVRRALEHAAMFSTDRMVGGYLELYQKLAG